MNESADDVVDGARATDRGNAQWQIDLEAAYDKIGSVLLAQDKHEEALVSYREALAVRERLAATDRSNTGWQRDLGVSYDNVGDVLVRQDKLEEALAAIHRHAPCGQELKGAGLVMTR